MNQLDPELRSLAEGVRRPGVNEGVGKAVAAAMTSHGRLGSLAGWWANVRPDGPPHTAVLAWSQPGWDDLALTQNTPLLAAPPIAADPADSLATLVAGVEAADAAIDAGADLILVRLNAEDSARRLVCAMLTLDATEAFGWPRTVAGEVVPSDAEWIAAVSSLRDDLRGLRVHAGRPADVLEALGDPVLTAGSGLILQAAARRTPMVLAGLGALACASAVRRTAPSAFAWWQIADTVDDPLHRRMVTSSNLTPILAFGSDTDGLLGGRIALGVVEAAAQLVSTVSA